MPLIVRGEVFEAARDGDSAVGTLVSNMRWWHLASLLCFGVVGVGRGASGLVLGVRAVRILSYYCCSAPDVWGRGVGEGVEEVVGS